MTRILSLFFLLLSLSACSFGPDAESLRNGVAERLAQALPADTFTLASFERRGSQSDIKAPPDETRRIVYFDVTLKLERDFDFGAWDGPGLAGMVSALGTAPKGIVGIISGGNKAGDTIRAHGTAIYKKEGDHWVPALAGAYSPAEAPTYATNMPNGAAAILDAMRKVIDSVSREGAVAQRVVIEEELGAAYAAIRARMARATDGYAIAAGPEHGQYLLFAKALSDGKSARTVPLVTQGGVENIRMLRDGKVPLALAQGDAALQAYEGKGEFAGDGAYPALQAIGSLYPEPVHVLVRTDSNLVSFAGLAGKRVAIGRNGSASRSTALRVLQAHGMDIKDIVPVELALGEALVALRNKQVDAVIQVIGMPADSVRSALNQVPLRLLSLSPKAITTMSGERNGYFSYTIPAGAYENQTQSVHTVATAALLLVDGDLSETEVGTLTRFVFGAGTDLVARGSAQGAQVSVASARLGLPVPLHIAAAQALEAMAKK